MRPNTPEKLAGPGDGAASFLLPLRPIFDSKQRGPASSAYLIQRGGGVGRRAHSGHPVPMVSPSQSGPGRPRAPKEQAEAALEAGQHRAAAAPHEATSRA